jgi:hypothetical protein
MSKISGNEIVEQYDEWTDLWNKENPDTVRERWVDFLLNWRDASGDWLTDVSDRFFEFVEPLDIVNLDGSNSFSGHLKRLHLCNNTIWNFEDEARRDDVSKDRTVTIKRGIDAVNQKRNDMMEELDEYFVREVQPDSLDEDVPLHTEPPGLVCDRLSIMSLKIYHYGHQDKTREVQALKQQRNDLSLAFDDFLNRMNAGNVRVKIYRQYKTYNDPETNPALNN